MRKNLIQSLENEQAIQEAFMNKMAEKQSNIIKKFSVNFNNYEYLKTLHLAVKEYKSINHDDIVKEYFEKSNIKNKISNNIKLVNLDGGIKIINSPNPELISKQSAKKLKMSVCNLQNQKHQHDHHLSKNDKQVSLFDKSDKTEINLENGKLEKKPSIDNNISIKQNLLMNFANSSQVSSNLFFSENPHNTQIAQVICGGNKALYMTEMKESIQDMNNMNMEEIKEMKEKDNDVLSNIVSGIEPNSYLSDNIKESENKDKIITSNKNFFSCASDKTDRQNINKTINNNKSRNNLNSNLLQNSNCKKSYFSPVFRSEDVTKMKSDANFISYELNSNSLINMNLLSDIQNFALNRNKMKSRQSSFDKIIVQPVKAKFVYKDPDSFQFNTFKLNKTINLLQNKSKHGNFNKTTVNTGNFNLHLVNKHNNAPSIQKIDFRSNSSSHFFYKI